MRPRVNAGALVEASINATDQAKKNVLWWDCISALHFGTGSRIFSQALVNVFHQIMRHAVQTLRRRARPKASLDHCH
jgi:hypothetical protein